MSVPVGLLGARVLGVVLGEEEVGHQGRDDDVDEGVEGGGANDFVDMERQGREGQTISPRLAGFGQSRNRGEREGIPHVDGDARRREVVTMGVDFWMYTKLLSATMVFGKLWLYANSLCGRLIAQRTLWKGSRLLRTGVEVALWWRQRRR